MKIGRIPLTVALLLGLLALGRLSWSGYNYVRAINAINQINVTVEAHATTDRDHVRLLVQIHNDSALPLTVQSLALNLYGAGSDSIGATYDSFEPLHLAPHTVAEVTRDLTIITPNRLTTTAQLRGDAVVRLPLTGHYFRHPISATWTVQS